MFNFFMRGGYMMWFLLAIGITIIILSIMKATKIFKKNSSQTAGMQNGINTIIQHMYCLNITELKPTKTAKMKKLAVSRFRRPPRERR